jgi:ABC-type phosphate/phosphonate transport system substrate-binding protein
MKKYLLLMCVAGMIVIANCGSNKTDDIDIAVKEIKTLDNTVTPQEPITGPIKDAAPAKEEFDEEAK